MKASRLPRPTGPTRPLPVFTTTELARKRLRHLSSSSSGSCSSSLAAAPAKVHRGDSLPPSPPPVFSDYQPNTGRHSSGSSRLPGASASDPAKGTAKDLTCSHARDRNRVSAVGAPPSGKPKKTAAVAKTHRPDGGATKPHVLARPSPVAAASLPVKVVAKPHALARPSAAATSASLPDHVPPPAPQRPSRVRKKDETLTVGHRSFSPMPSTSAAPSPSTSDAATPPTSDAAMPSTSAAATTCTAADATPSTSATAAPSTAAAAVPSQDHEDTNPPADDDDGFTIVSKKKKGKKGRKTGGAEDITRPSENSLLPEPRPAPAPRTSLAPRQDPAPRPTPAPRRTRPSVSVTRPQPPASEFPAFRVPAQEGYGTSYDAVAALEERFPFLNTRNMIGKDQSSVLIPLNQESFDALEAAAANPGEMVKLIKLDPKTELTKGVVMGFPLRMPVALLKRLPQIEEASRCVSSRLQEETKQVIITVRGPLPPQVDLGNWGIFYTRPYTPEPLRCFKCQRFGHHQANCSRPPVCGICSARHPTQQCLEKYKAKTEVRHKCPNCGQGHHAWNPNCPVRLQRVNTGREKQVQWVKDQQQTTLVPAPPGTFVWGGQRQNGSKGPQSTPQQEDFPPLLETATVPQAVAEASPAQRLPAATPTPPAATPPPPPQSNIPPGCFLMNKDVLTHLCKSLSMAIFQVTLTATGATVDFPSIEETCSKITENIIRQVLEETQGSTEGATAAAANSSATTPMPMASD